MGANIRVVGLFVVMFVMFGMIGYGISYIFPPDMWMYTIILFLILAGVMNAITYFYSARIILWSYKVRIVSEKEAPRTHRIVDKVVSKAKIPKPKVGIMEVQTPNAFATGRNPKNAVVCVTEGLLELLNDNELEGVISHEIAHVKDRDILVMSVASTLAMAIGLGARFAMFSMWGRRDREMNPLLLVLLILVPLAALLVQLSISRSREYKADYVGARTIGRPLYLASALEKLDRGVRRKPLHSANPASSSLFIVNPFSGGTLVSIFSTHPPVKERIKRLRELPRSTFQMRKP